MVIKINKFKKSLLIFISFLIIVFMFLSNPSFFLGASYIWRMGKLVKAADAWIIPYWQRSIIEKITWEVYKNSH